MGAVLMRENEQGVVGPVSFFSKFSHYQVNHSIIEKETLALVRALQHFKVWYIVVYTDHNPLTFYSHYKAVTELMS